MGEEYTSTETELTRLLLVELLAHQFCFPVQWIKTQDSIFGDLKTERFVEIGPAETLKSMARTTLASTIYKTHDKAQGFQRVLLSYSKDCDEIYYSAPAKSEPEPELTPPLKSELKVNSEPVALAMEPKPDISPPNIPPTSLDAIECIVALALRKAVGEISHSQSVKALCGGRSTVQNEIIGDLTKEFGSLPDQPEDVELSSLATELSEAGKGSTLGPCMNTLIGKVASTKMPAGFSIARIRKYLESTWKFQSGLQDRVLITIVSSSPTARLPDEKEASLFLDSIAHRVMKEIGFDIAQLKSANQSQSAVRTVATPEGDMRPFQDSWRAEDEALSNLFARRCNKVKDVLLEEYLQAKEHIENLERKVDAWAAEHDDLYEQGIIPAFDVRKIRKYDSYWNWVVQDLFLQLQPTQRDDQQAYQDICMHFSTRATPNFLNMLDFQLQEAREKEGASLTQEKYQRIQDIKVACESAVSNRESPRFKHIVASKMPVLDIDEQGITTVREILRPVGLPLPMLSKIKDRFGDGSLPDSEIYTPDSSINSSTSSTTSPRRADTTWNPEIQTKSHRGWRTNHEITATYLNWFEKAAMDGMTLEGKVALITGAGKHSIGGEIVTMMLAAGAKVIVTTSSFSKSKVDWIQSLYAQYGAHASGLIAVPFNGASKRDVQSLIDHIYTDPSRGGLGLTLDYIVPFAAVGEAGRMVDNLDGKSEVAHRVMLTNLLRLLGAVKEKKEQLRLDTRPTYAILPLSPNHGTFGRDGLYAESKIGLEALMNKWWSEDWREYICIFGVVIGWTRGTGLMSTNDILATGLESSLGVQTFSAKEMAWYIVGLMDSDMASFADMEPLKVDLSGGLSPWGNLKPILDSIQQGIRTQSAIAKALYKEKLLDMGIENPRTKPSVGTRKAKIRVGGVSYLKDNLGQDSQQLPSMVDLDRVPVVVGIGEAGPCGSARTRWEAECQGTFSIEGCLELAWIMGLVKYFSGPRKGKPFSGWIDQKTDQPITDVEIKIKYEGYIIEHTGIRLIERQAHDFASPEEEEALHEVAITTDMEPFEVSLEAAADLKREHKDHVVVEGQSNGQASVRFRAGARLYIPKALPHHHAVRSQMPTGWDPKRFGIPEDIIAQVDPVTLFALVATSEALLSAGIEDPYELYDHVNVADVGNAVGSGAGGQRSLHAMYRQRYVDKSVQKDILAETFVNTTAAWLNMLLLGSSGPIRTPVGACATALESVDTGADLIRSGKAKVVLVGGADTLERRTAQEFANMQATINIDDDAAAGRTPKEASRPTTSSRAGFVQGEGCGVQILTTASLALKMGLPIRAVIALTHTASDQIGRSVPAPGKGLLSIAAEKRAPYPSPWLNMSYRRRQLEHRIRQINETTELELGWIKDQTSLTGTLDANLELSCHTKATQDAYRAIKEAQFALGNDFWRTDPSISPLRGALAVWGLTVDDIHVASLHGTSTKKNDVNETAVIQQQLQYLGRTKGNVLPCVVQKSLLGHGLAAAGGFALNGCIQMLDQGIIPGNRNADNIDPELRDRDFLFFPSKTYTLSKPVKAFSVTSFGFGQKGAQVVGVHPRYLFANVSKEQFAGYLTRVKNRMAKADQAMQTAVYGGKLVKFKDQNVWESQGVEEGLLKRVH
ncbi:thiolase-like protein [Periconia macrospinosa]|uniref:beta-ketoacyl-[acyl-carrier-protein] synthase I n=1 Tax=Periconia macrospinosa TaxID=97972 RepID=A0A2V1DNA3_9PLEO|nr:thiolase-like protein [Periconia macrospinosa]